MHEQGCTRCCVCGGTDSRIAGVPLASARAKAVTPGWEPTRAFQCSGCGLYYAYPMPVWNGNDFQSLYDADYFGPETKSWHHMRTRIDPERRLDAVKRELPAGITPRILDIGCGQGYVLEHALRLGWDAWGLEPSQFWAKKTADRLGIKVWPQSVEEADIPEASCDIVFSDSVIEHLREPVALMHLARRVLKPGGIAYIVTPNANALVNSVRGLIFRLNGSRRTPYIEPLSSPYHLVGFTPFSLKLLAEQAGFSVRHLRVDHGTEDWRRDRDWTPGKLKQLALWPALFLGEIVRRGTIIDALLIAASGGGRHKERVDNTDPGMVPSAGR